MEIKMTPVAISFDFDPKETDIDSLIDEIETILTTERVGSTYSADMDDGKFVICAEIELTDQTLDVLRNALSRFHKKWNIEVRPI